VNVCTDVRAYISGGRMYILMSGHLSGGRTDVRAVLTSMIVEDGQTDLDLYCTPNAFTYVTPYSSSHHHRSTPGSIRWTESQF
jgi:hypothetical protein